ncbi:MAG: toxin-antitoxin system HigB family toxin component [Idiomarinaceae bacterium HL-53]|nr:MAG: toxin-antitoxin system HigB family toxin component [Idiomarinaceae bacterium HL-53]CUS48038.1 proteic killer suppression protein [Idiomarinaceae bacterium HL-53]
MINSFKCKDTERLASGFRVPRFKNFERVALRKLRQLEIAKNLNDLRVPPGNHLEELSGNLSGWHSIRINGQFRLCFKWENGAAYEVHIIDYH